MTSELVFLEGIGLVPPLHHLEARQLVPVVCRLVVSTIRNRPQSAPEALKSLAQRGFLTTIGRSDPRQGHAFSDTMIGMVLSDLYRYPCTLGYPYKRDVALSGRHVQ